MTSSSLLGMGSSGFVVDFCCLGFSVLVAAVEAEEERGGEEELEEATRSRDRREREAEISGKSHDASKERQERETGKETHCALE